MYILQFVKQTFLSMTVRACIQPDSNQSIYSLSYTLMITFGWLVKELLYEFLHGSYRVALV